MNAALRIAGAGPAGLAAAIVLARGGRRVVVSERRSRVGDRFLGGFQMLENATAEVDAVAELAGFGIAPACPLEPVHEAVLFDHRLRPREIRSRRPYGYFLRRGPGPGTLDTGLLEQAQELGVEVRFGEAARPHEVDVVATGPASCDGLARELNFTTTLGDRTWVLFDQRLAPGGYAYLFVRSGWATLGTAIVADFKSIDDRFAECMARFQQLEPFTPQDPHLGYSVMNFTLKQTAREGVARFAGEAGGFQDLLFGLGMRYAMVSGALAARSLLADEDYDALWRARLARAQETSVVNRFLYELAGNRGLAGFALLAARGDFREYLAGWQTDVAWKRLLLRWLRPRWQPRAGCRHALPGHWCRQSAKSRAEVIPTGVAEVLSPAARSGS